MDTFTNGNIISLTLTNFQAFSSQTFRFKPSLNIIAAPNGSGKSSVANAIAFVFNGAPKTIGKTKEISEFIKFGEQEASIIAHVFCNGRPIQLERQIRLCQKDSRYVSGNSARSLFYVDGKLVSQKDYASSISALGIDVNSLCAFLPQERVAEFCTMDPAALLTETLRGTEIDLDALYGIQREIKSVEDAIATKSKKASMVASTISHMEGVMEKVREREEKERCLLRLEYKHAHIVYEEAKDRYLHAKQEATLGQAKVQEYEREAMQKEAQIAELEASEAFTEYNKGVGVLEAQNAEIEAVCGRIKQTATALGIKRIDLESLVKKERQREEESAKRAKEAIALQEQAKELEKALQKSIRAMKDKIKGYFKKHKEEGCQEERLDGCCSAEELEQCLPSSKALDGAVQECLGRMRQIQFKSQQLQRQIDELEQVKVNYTEQKNQRMELLKKYHADTHKAVEWLRGNQGLFEDEIFEPAFLHVNIHKDYVIEVESLLSFQALSSFLVRNRRDMAVLSRCLKDEQRLAVNLAEVVDHRPTEACPVPRQFSVDGFASDFIEARKEYKDFFNAYGHFDTVPISKAELNEAEFFSAVRQCKRMVVAGRYVEIKRSRYSDDFIIVTNRINSKGLFTFPKIEISKINERLAALKEERETNRKEMDVLCARRTEHSASREAFKKDFDMGDIMGQEYALRRIRAQHNDAAPTDGEEYRRLIGANEEEQRVIEKQIAAHGEALCELLNPARVPHFDLESIKDARLDIENSRRALLYTRHMLESDRRALEEALARKAQCRRAVEEAKAMVRAIEGVDKNDLLEDLPDDKEEIAEQIGFLAARLELLRTDSAAREEFASKENLLNALSCNIGSLEQRKEALAARHCEEKERLERAIQEFLAPVNDKFSEMFGRLGFAGQLELATDEQWALNIMVGFRAQEEMQRLSSFRQSGGEKSLSTILFLLSLQQCQTTPFRLVDEINQGMDAHNECKVFEILKEMSSQSQFFIITPKLVEGLCFAEDTNAIILYGGPGITKDLECYIESVMPG